MEQLYTGIQGKKFISCVFSAPGRRGSEMRRGESNICCQVLLDMGRAKAHKVGYYLCKSMRVPKPRGKQAVLHPAGLQYCGTAWLLQHREHLDGISAIDESNKALMINNWFVCEMLILG